MSASNTPDIIFLDKDDTLGEFSPGQCGLYPGVASFLDGQKQQDRKLYIATTASEAGKDHLTDIADKLDGYLGIEKINAYKGVFFILSDGTIKDLRENYKVRMYFESSERREQLHEESRQKYEHLEQLPAKSKEREHLQQELDIFWEYWQERLHKETRTPFDISTLYKNPYATVRGWEGFLKDLFLARRLIAPQGYEQLRTVMVGDRSDLDVPGSDPETPVIIVPSESKSGNWRGVSTMLDTLFSNPAMKPWQVYENIFSQTTGSKRRFSIKGMNFTLKKGEDGERQVFCR